MADLVKIDKNGTKYYEDNYKCSKCHGTGYIQYFHYQDYGKCYDCDGTGVVHISYREYTPEYQAKLNAKRLAKKIKMSEETNKQFLAFDGYNAQGETWVVLGDTFAIKDELKLSGAIYNPSFGWHFDHETSYPCVKITVDEVCHKNEVGEYCRNDDIVDYVKAIKEKNTPKEEVSSNYVGEIGEKVSFEVKCFKRVGTYDSPYGVMFIYQFKDKDGNVYIWKTNSYCENATSVKGTIKEHSEYKGIKQNILIRCRIGEVNA